jgi:hypothetical protein
MTQQNNPKAYRSFLIFAIFAVLAVQFSEVSQIWLPLLYGIAAGISLSQITFRSKCFVFLAIVLLSLLETKVWFLGDSTLKFGLAGLSITLITQKYRLIPSSMLLARGIQIAPILITALMMPLVASLLASKHPARGILDGGVWATTSVLPTGQEALSTKYQYTYDNFKGALNAEIIHPGQSLDIYDEIVVITPTVPMDAQYVEKIANWTKRGGRLLVIADHTNLFGHQTVLKSLIDQFGISLQPDALFETETNGGTYSNWFEKFAGLTPCSISAGVIPRLKMNGWSERPDYTATSFFGDLDPTNDDKWGHYTVLGSRRVGFGEVSVFSDSTFFANFAIHRWSSQSILSSLFWAPISSIIVLLGVGALFAYLKNSSHYLLVCAMLCVGISPSLGFRITQPNVSAVINLKPPDSAGNDSEERDKGTGSSLLASAYAFNVNINWDKNANLTFKNHIETKGIALPNINDQDVLNWDNAPQFDIHQIIQGKFYLDQNSFWYTQGVGLIRAANMANCWKTLGVKIPEEEKIQIISDEEKSIRSSAGVQSRHKITTLNNNWIIFDNRIIAKWVPDANKWLIRKEWQLGPWIKKDQVYEPIK